MVSIHKYQSLAYTTRLRQQIRRCSERTPTKALSITKKIKYFLKMFLKQMEGCSISHYPGIRSMTNVMHRSSSCVSQGLHQPSSGYFKSPPLSQVTLAQHSKFLYNSGAVTVAHEYIQCFLWQRRGKLITHKPIPLQRLLCIAPKPLAILGKIP